MNINFNEHNIFFKYKGIDIATSPDPDIIWSNLSTSVISTYNLLVANGYRNLDAVDIYVPRESSFGGSEFSHSIFLNTFALDDLTLHHEMGHALDLDHTFKKWIDHNNDGSVNTSYTECEHVTRDVSDTNYNADTNGDEITDTAAAPDFAREWCSLNPSSSCSNFYEWYSSCEYTGSDNDVRTDCIGTVYYLQPVDNANYMNNTPLSCSDVATFSEGQAVRMKQYILASHNPDVRGSVASLFEPYRGEYYLAGPSLENPPLFQPGFDYKFVSCGSPNEIYNTPVPYENTSFTSDEGKVILDISKNISSLDFSSITHPNHTAIIIEQLDDGARRCYNNYNRAPVGGTVIKFRDGVFNTNVDISPQDSTAINNAQLVNDLPQGLYKIEKNYNDGTVDQTVIIKNNN